MSEQARHLYSALEALGLELLVEYLGLELLVEYDPDGPLGCGVSVGGLKSLSPSHADRIARLVRENEAELLMALLDRRDGEPCVMRTEASLA